MASFDAYTSTSAAASAVAGAAGAVASEVSADSTVDKSPDSIVHGSHEDAVCFHTTMEEQIFTFKDTLARESFFDSSGDSNSLSLEETGRVLGPLFAHDSLDQLYSNVPYYHEYSREGSSSVESLSVPLEIANNPIEFGHYEIDKRFSTDYGAMFSNPGQEVDFTALSYQMRGEKALEFGYYDQAINDFSQTIDMHPTNPLPYLQRSISYFNTGEYDSSLEDFQIFTSQADQVPTENPLSVTEFTYGFAQGLPKGVYESGEGIILFLADFVTHPVHSSKQVIEAFSTLADLARNDEWGVIGESLAPEICQLINEWDVLPSEKRGELAGYALGKHGGDILVPGAMVKVASKSVKSAKELGAICKNIKVANETLVLETASEIGNGVNVKNVMNSKYISRAKELGFTPKEISKFEKKGIVKGDVASISKNPLINIYEEINFTEHALQRAIERGVSREAILDAIHSPLKVNPVKIDQMGRQSQRFIGIDAEVVINPETQTIVSVNPTSSRKALKLTNEISNVSGN